MLKKRSSRVCGKQQVMSPTSILETKPFSLAGNHFFSDRKPRGETKFHPWDVVDSKKVGLGIVDALNSEKTENKSSKIESRMVLFGSQLKVRIPSKCQNASDVSPQSLIEFGVKNKDSKLAMSLISPQRRFLASSLPSDLGLSPSEMELSEDYTRVVSHGPNPRTIHIFDTCTLESCSNGSSPLMGFASHDFLAFCQNCRKKLGLGKDIFMYRGEKAFCSQECRNREMLFDEEMENLGREEPPAASP